MADIEQVQWNLDNEIANFFAHQSTLALTQINQP